MRRRLQAAAAVILLAAGQGAVRAEESRYSISAWRTDDGLPPLVSPLLLETAEGYLWMESEAGPVRFDGARFTVFNRNETGWAEGVKVVSYFAGRGRGLWVFLTDRTLWRELDGKWILYGTLPEKETITMMQPAPDGAGMLAGTGSGRLLRCGEETPGLAFIADAPPGFLEWHNDPDNEGGVWLSAVGGAKRWLNGQFLDVVYPGPENRNDFVFSWSDKSKWIIGPDYVAKWRDGLFCKLPLIAGLAPQKVAGVLPAPPLGVWASTVDRLYFLKEGASAWDGPYPWATATEQRQRQALPDLNGHHWIATYGFGFVHVSPEGKRMEERLPPDLAGNRLLNLREDREHNIWAVAEGSGLVRLRAKRFTVHQAGAGLSDPEVLAVCEDTDGALWAGSRAGGADVRRDGAWHHITLPPGDEPVAGVTSLLPHPDGLLAGTSSRGVWQQKEGRWTQLGGKQYVRALFCDMSGILWMGGPAGLFVRRGTEWLIAPAAAAWPGVVALAQDAEGRLWAGTGAGVWRADRTGLFGPVPDAEGLPPDAVYAFRTEPDGTLWIGYDNGLARWSQGKAVVRRMSEGLPFQRVSGIFPPVDGRLWISSPEGLASLEMETFAEGPLVSRVFARGDGLPTKEASGGFQPSVWRGGDGRFWLPTHLGLVEFNPGSIPPPSPAPPVVIEEAFASNEGTLQKLSPAGLTTDRERVQPGLRRMEFRFTAPSLSAPENVRFRWRLEGLDTAWSQPSAQRTVSYATLPPGDYRFQVIACNGDGIWNETGAAVAFTVPPLWHERPLIWVALALAAAGLAGLVVRSRYRRRIELLHLRSTLANERARIAQDIHDDLGATLTQISLWSAFAGKQAGGPVAGHLGLIRERSIDAVRSLDQIVWAVNPGNDTVKNFVTYLCQMAGDFLRETEMSCRIDLQEPVEDGPLNADVRHHLVLAAREACTNALRHSRATEVSLHVRAAPARIFIVIGDNGCGFNPAAVNGDTEGLAGMARRLCAVGGRCTVESISGQGTLIKLEWPATEEPARN